MQWLMGFAAFDYKNGGGGGKNVASKNWEDQQIREGLTRGYWVYCTKVGKKNKRAGCWSRKRWKKKKEEGGGETDKLGFNRCPAG